MRNRFTNSDVIFFIDQLLGYLRIRQIPIGCYELLILSPVRRFSNIEIIVLLKFPAVSELSYIYYQITEIRF